MKDKITENSIRCTIFENTLKITNTIGMKISKDTINGQKRMIYS